MRDSGWFKSSRSAAASDNCVEVRLAGRTARIRDSKNPAGGHLTVSPSAFAALVNVSR